MPAPSGVDWHKVMFKDGKEQKRRKGWLDASQKPETEVKKSNEEREAMWMMCTAWVLGLGRLPTFSSDRAPRGSGRRVGWSPTYPRWDWHHLHRFGRVSLGKRTRRPLSNKEISVLPMHTYLVSNAQEERFAWKPRKPSTLPTSSAKS